MVSPFDASGPLDGDVRLGLRAAIRHAALEDEQTAVERWVAEARLMPESRRRAEDGAAQRVAELRQARAGSQSPLDRFFKAFRLSDRESVALMGLVEALPRIPDPETAHRLIRDKMGDGDWRRHLGGGGGSLVMASIRALVLAGRGGGIEGEDSRGGGSVSWYDRLIARLGEPVARQGMIQAVRVLGGRFVLARTMAEALERAREWEREGTALSYTLLGEAACDKSEAVRHWERVMAALDAIGTVKGGRIAEAAAPDVSIKLSALHPRLEWSQRERVMRELVPRVQALALKARQYGLGLVIDAEDAHRLEPTLDVVEAIHLDPALAGWEGFGVTLQAYQKRASAVIDWLAVVAGLSGRRLTVRLVKGAYWDGDMRRAQDLGLPGYPVLTRKLATDTAYLACARKLLEHRDVFHPQFATHNAHTIAAVIEWAGRISEGAGGGSGFEFQRLYGMGETLYRLLRRNGGVSCRLYAPVGAAEETPLYLTRRLVENGAAGSFVNRVRNPAIPVAAIVADPVERLAAIAVKPHPRIPLPVDLHQPEYQRAAGIDLSDPATTALLLDRLETASGRQYHAAPIVAGRSLVGPESGRVRPVYDPADHRRRIGTVAEATVAEIEPALAAATRIASDWAATPVEQRAEILERVAALLVRDRFEFMALLIREAGKTIADALAEVREAEDVCRYTAARARADLAASIPIRGRSGEASRLLRQGRGVFVCISPWTFPLSIFLGQVTAALVAGNPVVAKPAGRTPLIAVRAVQVLLEAGVPVDAIHILPGPGELVGARLVADSRVAGVSFTGSLAVARTINRTLAARSGPILPLIAETGGLNALIVDSSAALEAVISDVLACAFGAAGQRGAALRVLFLQEEISDRVINRLAGAAEELVVGDPGRLETDIGPVIDDAARAEVSLQIRCLRDFGPPLFQAPLAPGCEHGSFVAPLAFALDRGDLLDREIFGPLLRIASYPADRLDGVLEMIRAAGPGWTLGIHSRIDQTQNHICALASAGDRYVNGGMVGAGFRVGEAQGWRRYVGERIVSVNMAAVGGDLSLIDLDEDG